MPCRLQEGHLTLPTATGTVIIETATFEDLGDGRTKLVSISQFFSQEERDGMMNSGMEGGKNPSYAALDRLLASMS